VKKPLLFAAVLMALLAAPVFADHAPFEGWAKEAAVGLQAQEIVQVTSLADSGENTLRECVSESNRVCQFSGAAANGTIALSSVIEVTGSYVWIDGPTTDPGITLSGHGIRCRGDLGCHNLMVSHIRVRNTAVDEDAFSVWRGAHDVIFYHVSATGAHDGNIDITGDTDVDSLTVDHDVRRVLVQSSIIARSQSATRRGRNSLVALRAREITMHDNLFEGSSTRSPKCAYDAGGLQSPLATATCDIRNNVIANWQDSFAPAGFQGSFLTEGAKVNVVDNFYTCPGCGPSELLEAIVVCAGGSCGTILDVAGAYLAGNGLYPPVEGFDPNSRKTTETPFPAPAVAARSLCATVNSVLGATGAGAQPRDSIDLDIVGAVDRGSCGGGGDTTPPTVSVTEPSGGATVSGTVTVSATASDNVGVVGVQFKLDGANLGTEDMAAPYSIAWNTATATNGSHTITAVARDAAGNSTTSAPVSVTVSNAPVVVTRNVEASENDAHQASSTVFLTTASVTLSSTTELGARFPATGVPQGKTIVSAKFRLACTGKCLDNVTLTLSGQQSATTAAFTATPDNLSSRPRTATYTVNPPDWSTSALNEIDVRDIVQAIVNESGWNGDVVIFVKGGRQVATWNHSTRQPPQLEVTYQP
jgi:hypothetical protein